MPKHLNRLHLPKFLGIGAQKAGTTWLHSVLAEHPDLALPHRKETHFFENSNYYSKGVPWYRKQFNLSSENQIVGEINPGYLWVAPPPEGSDFVFDKSRCKIPERIKETLGEDLKLIVMLRNPVDRAISAYVHHASKGRLDPEGDRLQSFMRFGIAHIGFYYSHICHWLKYFPKEKFKFYCYEDVNENKSAFYQSIYRFLGISLPNNIPIDEPQQFFAKYRRDPEGVRVIDVVKKSAQATSLTAGLLIADAKHIDYLRELYTAEVAKLRKLLDIDLSPWDIDFPNSKIEREDSISQHSDWRVNLAQTSSKKEICISLTTDRRLAAKALKLTPLVCGERRRNQKAESPDHPLVSVITVCRNAQSTIAQAVDSVLAQTYPDVEHIIIDGASTDSTMRILKDYNDKIACVVSEPDTGIYNAMNKGLGYALGSYIVILNADDRLEPQFIQASLDTISRTGADISYCDVMTEDGIMACASLNEGILISQLSLKHNSFLCRADCFERIGGFDENNDIVSDARWIRAAYLSEMIFVKTPGSLVFYSTSYSALPG